MIEIISILTLAGLLIGLFWLLAAVLARPAEKKPKTHKRRKRRLVNKLKSLKHQQKHK